MKVSKLAGWFGGWGALAALAIVLSGCQGPKFADVPGVGAQSGGVAAPAAAGASDMERGGIDRIAVGDNLYIVFADLPVAVQPIKERVREDGTIMLLQNQSFTAKGKLRGELEKEIRDRYVPNFYKTMTV